MEDDVILYDVKDIQRIFKMKRSKAYQLMRCNCFPTIKIGRTRYVTKEGLEKFLKQNYNREIFL